MSEPTSRDGYAVSSLDADGRGPGLPQGPARARRDRVRDQRARAARPATRPACTTTTSRRRPTSSTRARSSSASATAARTCSGPAGWRGSTPPPTAGCATSARARRSCRGRRQGRLRRARRTGRRRRPARRAARRRLAVRCSPAPQLHGGRRRAVHPCCCCTASRAERRDWGRRRAGARRRRARRSPSTARAGTGAAGPLDLAGNAEAALAALDARGSRAGDGRRPQPGRRDRRVAGRSPSRAGERAGAGRAGRQPGLARAGSTAGWPRRWPAS